MGALRSGRSSVPCTVPRAALRAPRLLVVLVGAVLLCLLALAPASSRAATVDVEKVESDGVRAYWTPQRMREAEPLERSAAGPPNPAGGPIAAGRPSAVEATEIGSDEEAALSAGALAEPTRRAASVNRDEIENPAAPRFRAHGKVFLTIRGGSTPGDYVCSATAMASQNRSLVWSAGHCVFDDSQGGGGGGYASKFLFVPGYKDGRAPFGEWPAKRLLAPQQWRERGNYAYDLAAAVVARNGSGQRLTEVVGGRGIGFNQGRNHTYQAFGYPQGGALEPPEFTGEREFRCTSGLAGTDRPGPGPSTSAIRCDMGGGASGGGWAVGDTVLSVTSYSYCDPIGCERKLRGPYQGNVARRLYLEASGEAKFCGGHRVTQIGTRGDDRLVGTPGRDVFKARAGADVVIGRGGPDVVCAGSGADRLHGNRGADKLKGQRGNDVLRSGKGRRDICNGGPGRDRAFGCKVTRRAS